MRNIVGALVRLRFVFCLFIGMRMHFTFAMRLFFAKHKDMNFFAIISVTVIISTLGLLIYPFILNSILDFISSSTSSSSSSSSSDFSVDSSASKTVSLSHRFRFRFKLGFHRIKNYQTTWLPLSYLLCHTNPMMTMPPFKRR